MIAKKEVPQLEEQHQVIRGKYAYMAPEQVEGKALDGRTDLFALTIVLFESLTGRRLFKAKERNETLARVRRAEVPSPRAYRPEISENLENILFKGLSKDPQNRFASAGSMLESLSKLMIEEGHRATNHDLAEYLQRVIEAYEQKQNPSKASPKADRNLLPRTIIVASIEAAAPPRSVATPRQTIGDLLQSWLPVIEQGKGEVWEQNDGSMIVVWPVGPDLNETIQLAVRTVLVIRKRCKSAQYRLSVGIAPGAARISGDTRRPVDGWELAGPFYLARWMMNLSAHRGRILLTEVITNSLLADSRARKLQPIMLGRIPITSHGNHYINLYEV